MSTCSDKQNEHLFTSSEPNLFVVEIESKVRGVAQCEKKVFSVREKVHKTVNRNLKRK